MKEALPLKETIQQTVRYLGITRNYRGYRPLILAIELSLEDEDRMLNIMNCIYKPIGDELHCDYRTVERNIRTVINRVWNENEVQLKRLAGDYLKNKPTVSEFIDIIANHVRKTCRIHI